MLLLRYTLNQRIGRTGLPVSLTARLWTSALVAAGAAWAVKLAVPAASRPLVTSVAILGAYGLVFAASALALRIPEASTAISRLKRLTR